MAGAKAAKKSWRRSLARTIHETHGSTRRIRVENRTPQAGKTRLRLIVGGTRRAATGTPACTNRTPGAPPVTACAPCHWPTPHFSCDHDGLLRRFSTRTGRVAEKFVNNPG